MARIICQKAASSFTTKNVRNYVFGIFSTDTRHSAVTHCRTKWRKCPRTKPSLSMNVCAALCDRSARRFDILNLSRPTWSRPQSGEFFCSHPVKGALSRSFDSTNYEYILELLTKGEKTSEWFVDARTVFVSSEISMEVNFLPLIILCDRSVVNLWQWREKRTIWRECSKSRTRPEACIVTRPYKESGETNR